MAAPIAPPEASIRFASTFEDADTIHRFLLVVATPVLQCEVNAEKSLEEIRRITEFEAAIMLVVDGMMVGTMGLVRPTWWYGDADYLTDRWHFVLPAFDHTQASARLMGEAIAIAARAGLKFLHQGKIRAGKDGVLRLFPRIYSPESE